MGLSRPRRVRRGRASALPTADGPCSNRLRLLGEPCGSLLVEQRRERGANADMIRVQPVALAWAQQRGLDQRAVDRRKCQRLEPEQLALAAASDVLNGHEVLDANAVLAGLVVAGLVRDDHAGL